MQKIGQRFLMIALIVMMVVSSQTADAAAAFADTKAHWAKTEIDTAVTQGWINGYDASTFKPNANMTRAEFLKSLVGAMKLKAEDIDTPFGDDEGWYRAYIATGLKQSIIKVEDYEELKFDPKKNITREEIARMTIRALSKDAEGAKSGYLTVAKKLEIMKGYPDGTMGGEKNATRAEAVVMILNTLNAKNPQTAVVDYPKTKEEIDTLVKSLPSFKGTTTYGHNGVVLINTKGSDDFFDNTLVVEFNTEYKQTNIIIADPTADNKAIVKDLLKNYFPTTFEKAYASYIKVNDMKFVEGSNSIVTKYDGRSFGAYKANNNKQVKIEIGV